MKKTKNIGVEVKKTNQECNDKNCPFHGKLKLHGRTFRGLISSIRMQKTAVIEWERLFYLRKYERYEKRKTRIKAHIPDCIHVKQGDMVKIIETRPISKTINFVIVENESV